MTLLFDYLGIPIFHFQLRGSFDNPLSIIMILFQYIHFSSFFLGLSVTG